MNFFVGMYCQSSPTFDWDHNLYLILKTNLVEDGSVDLNHTACSSRSKVSNSLMKLSKPSGLITSLMSNSILEYSTFLRVDLCVALESNLSNWLFKFEWELGESVWREIDGVLDKGCRESYR